eukprot:XP_011427560.1 PREDICTED: putative GPI-anchored protein pfl2 isoform X2 [Crassostrea gigas]
MHASVFLGLLLFLQVISIIRGIIDEHGFCHQQQIKATFCVDCGSGFPLSIAISIVAGENEPNGDQQLFCLTPQWICSGSMTKTYNATSDTLEIGFIFNHTIHAGRYLRMTRVRNGSQENQQILLKPCWLPDGIQCMVPYIPGKAIQCILDGAVYNISAPVIATTTLTPETTEIELPTTSTENSDVGRFTSTEKSTPLQSVTTIPESSATSSKIITTTVESSTLSREQNVTTPLTKGSSTSKSIITTDNLPGSLNITTGSPDSLSTEQDIATFTEGQSTSNSITSTDNLAGSLNMTTESSKSLPTEQRSVTSTDGSKTSVETIGSRTTVKEETTTENLGTTVKPTNASSNGAITIINQNIIHQGFCHQQDVNIQLYINCGISFSASITVAIVTSKYETNPNTLLTCRRSNDSTWYCPRFDIMTGKFNSSSAILDINFKFNFTIHAGDYVRMISSCDGNQETKHIHLIPCFSEFTVNATFYNATSLVINCQHSSFNDSSSPIRIKLKGGNDIGACFKTSCNNCKRLRDGIQCYVLYAPESIYQCVLDGAIYNISLPTTQLEIQTTTPQNVSASQTVTTASENTTVSEKSVLTTLQRISTSSEGSTTPNSLTKTSSEGTTVETFDSTLTDNSQAAFSKDYITTESTTSRPGEISTSQIDIESSSTSRENVDSTTSAPHFESTSIQSTKIITTAPKDGATITIINKDEIDKGFCHLNDVEIQLCLGCKSDACALVQLSIVASVDDTYANDLLTCSRFSDVMWNCYDDGIVTGTYNVSSDVLDIRFNFNYTKYAGRFLRIKLFCDDDLEITHQLFKACYINF